MEPFEAPKIGRADTQHADFELMDHAGEKFYHLRRRLQSRRQERLAEGRHVGAERNRLGDIDARTDTPGRNQWHIRQRLAHAHQRFFRRDTPIGKVRSAGLPCCAARRASTADHEVPPLAGDVDGFHAGALQPPATSTEMPLPTSLATMGTSSSRQTAAIFSVSPLKFRLPSGCTASCNALR